MAGGGMDNRLEYVAGVPGDLQGPCTTDGHRLYILQTDRDEDPPDPGGVSTVHANQVPRLWKFCFTRHRWTMKELKDAPYLPPAQKEVTALIGNHLFLYRMSLLRPDLKLVRRSSLYAITMETGIWRTLFDFAGDGHGYLRDRSTVLFHGGKFVLLTLNTHDMPSQDIYLDMHTFDLETLTWNKPLQLGDAPKECHISAVVPYEDRLYFLLYPYAEDNDYLGFRKIHIYHVTSGVWQSAQTYGDDIYGYPNTRERENYVLVDGYVCIFPSIIKTAGSDEPSGAWRLHLQSLHWQFLNKLDYYCSTDGTKMQGISIASNGYVYGLVYGRTEGNGPVCGSYWSQRVCRFRLVSSSLEELCFEEVMKSLRGKKLKLTDYVNLGIPRKFLERLV